MNMPINPFTTTGGPYREKINIEEDDFPLPKNNVKPTPYALRPRTCLKCLSEALKFKYCGGWHYPNKTQWEIFKRTTHSECAARRLKPPDINYIHAKWNNAQICSIPGEHLHIKCSTCEHNTGIYTCADYTEQK